MEHIAKLLESEAKKPNDLKDTSLGANDGLWAKRTTVQRHIMAMENILVAFHANEPAATGMAVNALKQRYPRHLPDECFKALLEEAIATGKLVLEKNEISHPRQEPEPAIWKNRQPIPSTPRFIHMALPPPPVDDVFEEAGLDAAQGRKALLALEKQERALRVNKTYCFTAESLQQLQEATVACLQEKRERNGNRAQRCDGHKP